jgi:hypothetical protein
MPPWTTSRKLSQRYGKSVRTIHRAVADGRLPPAEFPLGANRPLFDMEKVEAAERAAIVKRPAGDGDAA